MKKLLLLMLFTLPLVLTGCAGNRTEDVFRTFSASVAERENLSFTADIRAEYRDRTGYYTLSYAGSADECVLTVQEPEVIAGVTMHYKNGKAVIGSTGYWLDAGELSPGLTPVNALPQLMKLLAKGYLDSYAKESGELLFVLAPEGERKASVWLDAETLAPTHAELTVGNTVCVFCDFYDWKE